jgi:flagellar motor protein MotB
LTNAGVPSARLTAQGLAWDNPVASNDTEAGRAQNRRVEIYITANQEMVDQANAGTLK